MDKQQITWAGPSPDYVLNREHVDLAKQVGSLGDRFIEHTKELEKTKATIIWHWRIIGLIFTLFSGILALLLTGIIQVSISYPK